ncbi:MAG: hypothetical protein ACOH16_00455 [Propionibacteriaceae bacterium]
MIALDDPARWLPQLDATARQYLSADELAQYDAIPPQAREGQLDALLTAPIAHFSVVNEALFRARWGEVLDRLLPPGPLTLLEVASGDADMIPQCMSRLRPGSRYIAANMNEDLNQSLVARMRGLDLDFVLVDDDAANIRSHLGDGQVDVIAFQHAVNDVLQAILCAREGVDTVQSDWMETLPVMIDILKRETAAGSLERSVREPFVALMQALLPTLRSGGYVALTHYMFQLDLDWGYPPDLHEDMLVMVRPWLDQLPGVREVQLEGFDPQWWMFLQKL